MLPIYLQRFNFMVISAEFCRRSSLKAGYNLSEGNIPKILSKMTVGMLIGHVAMTIFNLTDTYFVSMLGTKELAAMSFTFPFVMLVNHFLFGIGLGTSAVVSKAIGQKNFSQMKRITTDCLFLVVVTGIIISAASLIFLREIFATFGAEGETLELVLSYMVIWLAGLPIASIPMVVNNAIRATGNTKTPGLIMAFSSTLNIILDPLFIFGIWFFPEMGIEGAALATLIARSVSSVSAVSYMHFKMKMFDLSMPEFSKVMNSWKQILTLGVPSSLSLMLMPVSMAIITRIIATYGDAAVAASGAGGRIDTLTLMVIFALSSALLPFTGQNFGSGKLERVKAGLKLAQYFSFFWGVFMLLVIYLFKDNIASIFTTEQVVADYIVSYLTAMTVSYPAIGVSIMCANVLNGLHRPYFTAALNLFRTIVFAIPAAYIGGKIAGPQGIFITIATVNILASFVYHAVAVRAIKKAADKFDFERDIPEIPADVPV